MRKDVSIEVSDEVESALISAISEAIARAGDGKVVVINRIIVQIAYGGGATNNIGRDGK